MSRFAEPFQNLSNHFKIVGRRSHVLAIVGVAASPTAYRVSPEGKIQQKITTEQKAITNCKFGRGSLNNVLFLTSSDMERVTGYIYRAKLAVP